jgi:BirA family biotin operon repressor/biotin-[acetyl-CoA-carboxylase] ligase
MDEKLLQILREHKEQYTPADELMHKAKLSRPVFQRLMHKLCQEDYDIQFSPHLGYKLISPPDRITAQEVSWNLKTKIIGKKIYSYAAVDSTNNIVLQMAERAQAEGAVVFAESQRHGRGRLGRDWYSPKGKGLYFSFLLRPQILPSEAPLLTILSSVSVTKVIRKMSGLPALIKWPNDILINGHKVCGILTEMSAKAERVRFLVVGIGINVLSEKEDLPKGATSLKEESISLKHLPGRLELARELLRELDSEYLHFKKEKAEFLIAEWQRFSGILGSWVKVACQNKTYEGQVQGIDDNGGLILRQENGFTQRISAGEVVKVRA